MANKKKKNPARYTLERDILVLASQRSGHHGVMGWIRSAFDEVLYLNHVNPRSGKPHTPNFQQVINKKKGRSLDLAIYNIEGANLGELSQYKVWKKRAQSWLGKHDAKRKDAILVVRDPFNVIAGALNIGYPGHKIPKMMKILEQHYKQVLKIRNEIKGLYIINFNRWFDDPDYREQIAKDLDLPLADPRAKFEKLQGRSSFDMHKHKTTASEMTVLDRYKQLEGDNLKRWKNVFKKNPKVVELAEKIFGFNPFQSEST